MKLSGAWLHYSPENSPLPGSGAWPIAFDSKNRAWMCVTGKSQEKLGIAVFDGQNWTHYPPGYIGLPDQPIFDMIVDLHDHVWLHSPFAGIYEFDGERVVIHQPSFTGPLPLVLTVNTSAVDLQGNVWFAWPSVGVFRFDGLNWEVFNSANCGLTSNWVMAISTDLRGRLWLGVQNRDRAEIISFDGSEWVVHADLPLNHKRNQIIALAVDQNEHIWLGCRQGGLWSFDGSEWHHYTSRHSCLPTYTVYSLVVDRANRIWVGTPGGVAIKDGKKWAHWGAFVPNTGLEPMPREAADPGGPLAHQPYVFIGSFVAQDRQGRMWITSVDGMCVYVPS
jgi:ligand-binding sensor domain-containing protein